MQPVTIADIFIDYVERQAGRHKLYVMGFVTHEPSRLMDIEINVEAPSVASKEEVEILTRFKDELRDHFPLCAFSSIQHKDSFEIFFNSFDMLNFIKQNARDFPLYRP